MVTTACFAIFAMRKRQSCLYLVIKSDYRIFPRAAVPIMLFTRSRRIRCKRQIAISDRIRIFRGGITQRNTAQPFSRGNVAAFFKGIPDGKDRRIANILLRSIAEADAEKRGGDTRILCIERDKGIECRQLYFPPEKIRQ